MGMLEAVNRTGSGSASRSGRHGTLDARARLELHPIGHVVRQTIIAVSPLKVSCERRPRRRAGCLPWCCVRMFSKCVRLQPPRSGCRSRLAILRGADIGKGERQEFSAAVSVELQRRVVGRQDLQVAAR